MDYFYGNDINIIKKNDNNIMETIKNNNLNKCTWHSSAIPTLNDAKNEFKEREIYCSNKYVGYDEEITYKFVYDVNNNICYDNCNYKNRLDKINIARDIGEKIKNEKKPKILELNEMRSNIKLLLDKNQKIIKKNDKIIIDLNNKKIKLESETKSTLQIKKFLTDIDIKNKENENLRYVMNQLNDKLIQIDDTFKQEQYNEILNMDSIVLGQLSKS